MARLALVLVLTGLTACGLFEHEPPAGPDSVAGWRLASGRAPSHAEYAAVVAACRDGAVRRAEGKPLDACLADLGLKRAE
ncbi:MAG TPA: hypothetical protein VJR70_02065 [Stellaceae bacterium]|nr:hypothetical protein [Stellaceae bacterium]